MRVIIDQLENRVAALTGVANRVYKWSGAAALKLNASKTKAMLCGSRDFVDRIPHDLSRIEVSGIPVPYVETAENLGVTAVSHSRGHAQLDLRSGSSLDLTKDRATLSPSVAPLSLQDQIRKNAQLLTSNGASAPGPLTDSPLERTPPIIGCYAQYWIHPGAVFKNCMYEDQFPELQEGYYLAASTPSM